MLLVAADTQATIGVLCFLGFKGVTAAISAVLQGLSAKAAVMY